MTTRRKTNPAVRTNNSSSPLLPAAEIQDPTLQAFGRDMTQLARDGKLDP